MKTKEELLKIALSSKTAIASYEESVGFDDADKFLNAFKITHGAGPHIPIAIIYYFYYCWYRESIPKDNNSKKAIKYVHFCKMMCKYGKSIPYSDMNTHQHYRSHKLTNFPEYDVVDELQARKLIRVQKKNREANKKRQQTKRIRALSQLSSKSKR